MSLTSIKANQEHERQEIFIALNKRITEIITRTYELEKRIKKLEKQIKKRSEP